MFGTASAIVGVWFEAGAMFALSTLYPNDRLSGFAMATEDLSTCYETIKFDEKPICVEIEL